MSGCARALACACSLGLLAAGSAADELLLAAGGRSAVLVRVAADAIPAERNAAAELATYLGRVTGAAFRVVDEREAPHAGATIEVGPTLRARATIPDVDALPAEHWGIRSDGSTLFLYGGRPRGTLYAVYHFLEDQVGLRFWTPWEEHVPARSRLSVAPIDRTGQPAFGYRDVSGVDGPLVYRARRRHNGFESWLPSAWGGREAYGPPGQVHTAFAYVPPDEYFASHPEYFSEIDGLRYGDGQLCPSEEGVFERVRERLSAFVRVAEDEAARAGEPAPTLFDLSQNDWGRWCRCPRCAEQIAREDSPAAPWVAFLNRLAEWAAVELPGIRIDTLAYDHTFAPPRTLRLDDGIVVRVSALHQRDFAKPLGDPANVAVARAIQGWRERSRHTRIWDYGVLFGDEGELPLPNLGLLADDLRWYRSIGVEGLFVQLEDPIGSDLWDLKIWVLSQLLEDPARDLGTLVRDFTSGYYGRAASDVRAYLRGLERAARRHPAVLRYRAPPQSYVYLDAAFVLASQQRFERAERRVADDPLRLRRVRHARAALDRATLALWPELWPGLAGGGRAAAPLDRQAIERRFRATWREQAELRLGPAAVEPVLAEVDRQLAYWAARSSPAPVLTHRPRIAQP